MNKEHWRRYAQLLVRLGVGLRLGQPLFIYGEVAHRHLMALLTEVAYEAGGGWVETRLFDPVLKAALVRHGRFEDIELCHAADQAWLYEIARSGLFFNSTILDENASAHVALGQAYVNGIVRGEAMGKRELDHLGVNYSAIHTDVMFGSTSVSVVASESREGEVVLIDRGRWAERFQPVDRRCRTGLRTRSPC